MVGNTGGEPLDSEADVEMFHPSSDVDSQTSTIVVDELGSGDTQEVTVGPFDASYSGAWEFRGNQGFTGTHEEFELVVDVGSKEYAIGENFDHPSGLRFTLDELSVERGIHYRTTERPGLFGSSDVVALQTPASEQVIARFSMTVENRTSEPITTNSRYSSNESSLERTVIDFNHGSLFSPMNSTFEGEDVQNIELDAGESQTHYILSAVDIEDLDSLDLTVALTDDDSAPEIVTELDAGTDLPEFELVETRIPAQREEGEQEFGVVVENTGDAAGTFRGVIQWEDGGDWYHLRPELEAEIAPGETATVSATSDVDPGSREYEYRIEPFGEHFSL